jgi:hypothetical protein
MIPARAEQHNHVCNSQEALGFVAAPSILVITPLPDVINKKSHAAQIYWARMTIYKKRLHL